MTVPVPDILITCEAIKTTRWLKRRKPCRKPATHMLTSEHDPQGCQPNTIAVCEDHTPAHVFALYQRMGSLAILLANGVGAKCGHCGKTLENISDAGDITCLHE